MGGVPCHMEPDHGLHPCVGGLRQLPCRAVVEAIAVGVCVRATNTAVKRFVTAVTDFIPAGLRDTVGSGAAVVNPADRK